MIDSQGQSKKQPIAAHLKLSHKVVVLLAIPALVQIGLVVALSYLHSQAEQETARAEHARAISDTAGQLVAAIYANISVVSDAIDGHKPLSPAALSNAAVIESSGKHLQELLQDDPQSLALVSGSLDDAAQFMKKGTFAANNMRALYPPKSEGRKQVYRDLRKYGHRLERLLSLIRENKQYVDQDPVRQAQVRDQVKLVVMLDTIFNVLFLLLMGFFVSRYIIRRLDIIIDNSFRLAARTPLNARMSGADEIAKLDGVFHEMAKTLTEALRKERAIVENTRDVICSLDARGNFVDVSKAAITVFGYSPEDLVGNKLINFVAPEDKEHTLNELKIVMDGGTEPSFENRLVHKNGSIIDLLWSATWSQSEGTVFCVAHDNTERKQAERLRLEVERLRKEVVQMVSHDLRSPLTSIQGVLEMLQDGMIGQLDAKGKQLVSIADRNASRMLGLINDLLDIEKMEAGMLQLDKSSVALSTIFEQSVQTVQSLASQRGVKIELQPTDLSIYADGDRLVQILVNLLSNAVKFSNQGTRVVVEASQLPEQVEIKVVDQGRGIPPELKDSIFDRFKQVRTSDAKEQHGSGLGLAICKALVELHGGDISVESEVGKGTTFCLCFPSEVKMASQAVEISAADLV